MNIFLKKAASILLLLLLLLSLTACAGDSAGSRPPAGAAQPAPPSENGGGQNQDRYPVTVESYDSDGTVLTQTFEKAPERIVCCELSTAQLLLALGLGDKIVGATDSVGTVSPKYAGQFEKLNLLTEDGGYPAEEVVVAQEPDIIISWGSLFSEKNLGSAKSWNERGIHTYVLENTASNTGARTVERIYTDLEKLGRIFGIQDRAQEIIDDMKARVAAVREKTDAIPETDRPTVLTVQHVYENEFFGRADTDLTCDFIRVAGGVPLDKDFGRQSIENLIKLNPEVILVINRTDTKAADKIDALKSNPSLQNVPAVKNDRFVVVEYIDFYGGTPESIDFVEKFAKELYPELFQ
ncbi:MAG: ABC transporter substrate-binding protein [Peptococcaceae bacterium]|nr:ABC transporter substrate-binding protein [Peptococcaceae bacterium]